MNNCQVSNNGTYSLALWVGDFTLNHVTVANYFTQSSRKDPAVALTNNFIKTKVIGGEAVNVTYLGDANATFNNCIIYGALTNEFATGKKDGAELNYTLHNCIVRKDSISNNHYINCFNQNPKFIATYGQNYNLQEDSPAIDAGMEGLGITTDILGRPRNGVPDIGAYEYYPIPEEKIARR
jgi:phage major head subunit gpT-like protein